MLKIERIENGAVTVLRIHGEIDDAGAHALRQAVMACLQEQRYRIVLNLGGVVFLSYMGAGAFLDHLARIRACEGDIKLACMNLQASRLLDMMGLGSIFESYEVESSAVNGYKRAAA